MFKIVETLEEILIKEQCSKTELAKRIGIRHYQIMLYLNGHLPTLKNAIKIANFYKCSLDYLFSFTDTYTEIIYKRELDYTSFYKKYSDLLIKNNMTHYALSKKINICETRLSAWKNCKMPSTNAILEIANYFGVSIDYLVCKID